METNKGLLYGVEGSNNSCEDAVCCGLFNDVFNISFISCGVYCPCGIVTDIVFIIGSYLLTFSFISAPATL